MSTPPRLELSDPQRAQLSFAWRSDQRHTIERAVTVEGVGAHSGLPCVVHLRPLHTPQGVTFNGWPVSEWRREALWATRLTHPRAEGPLSTPEHLLAALYVAGVDDVDVVVSGAELPILDGSAAPWLATLSPTLTAGGRYRRAWRQLPPLEIERAGGVIITRSEPVASGELPLTATVSVSVAQLYPELVHAQLDTEVRAALLMTQEVTVLSAEDLWTKVMCARTFGLRRHEATLRARGLIQGVTEDSCLILDDHGVPHRAPYHNAELAAHKLLDCLGDLALSGERWRGHLDIQRGSHALNHALLSALEER